MSKQMYRGHRFVCESCEEKEFEIFQVKVGDKISNFVECPNGHRKKVEENPPSKKKTKEIDIRCPLCNELNTIVTDEEKYLRWESGNENVQDIFPELSPSEREVLITGICGMCWSSMFGN